MGLLEELNTFQSANELTGSFGEWLTKHYSNFFTDALVMHDVLIDGNNGYTSQIDVIMIGSKGVYVVEVKTFEGAKIYGNGKNSNWYYYRGGHKCEIYSPIKQNQKHIEYLKKLLADFGDIPFYSVVTMICDDFKVENINIDPQHPDTMVCSSLPSMMKGMQILTKDRPDVFGAEDKQAVFNCISSNQHKGKASRAEHKENVKKYKEKIEEMKKDKICPYCKVALVLRKGKFGDFYGCSNYPKCRYTLKTEKEN